MDLMDLNDEKLLNDNGWEVECYTPFEIRTKDGSFASGEAAWMVLHWLREQNASSPTYFVLRKSGCGVSGDGKIHTDIIGVTTDEVYAKSKNSVFCYYEPVILLDR
jgi:hypothetical protein